MKNNYFISRTLNILLKAQTRSLRRTFVRPFSEQDLNQLSHLQIGMKMIISLYGFLKINALINANVLK